MENIYLLNKSGSRIWELLDGKRPKAEIKEILIKEFEASAEKIEGDVDNFLSSLEESGLAERRSA